MLSAKRESITRRYVGGAPSVVQGQRPWLLKGSDGEFEVFGPTGVKFGVEESTESSFPYTGDD